MKVYILTVGEYYAGSEVTAAYVNKDQAWKEAKDLAQEYADRIFEASSDPRLSNPMKKAPIVYVSEETVATCTYMLKQEERERSSYNYFWEVKELELK